MNDFHIVVHPRQGTLFSHKKARSSDHATVWMNLEDTIPSERSQTQKARLRDSIHVRSPQKQIRRGRKCSDRRGCRKPGREGRPCDGNALRQSVAMAAQLRERTYCPRTVDLQLCVLYNKRTYKEQTLSWGEPPGEGRAGVAMDATAPRTLQQAPGQRKPGHGRPVPEGPPAPLAREVLHRVPSYLPSKVAAPRQ